MVDREVLSRKLSPLRQYVTELNAIFTGHIVEFLQLFFHFTHTIDASSLLFAACALALQTAGTYLSRFFEFTLVVLYVSC